MHGILIWKPNLDSWETKSKKVWKNVRRGTGLDIIQSHSLSSISLQQIQTPEIHTSPSDARMRNQMSEPSCHLLADTTIQARLTECTCTDGFRLHALLSWLHGTGLCSNSPSSAHSLWNLYKAQSGIRCSKPAHQVTTYYKSCFGSYILARKVDEPPALEATKSHPPKDFVETKNFYFLFN